MECPGCGGDVTETSTFCSRCGRRLGPPLAPPTAISADLPTERLDTLATEPVVVTDGPTIVLADDNVYAAPGWVDTAPTPTAAYPTAAYPTAVYPTASTTTAGVTAPIVFDGSDDLADYPEEREPFRLRAMFVIALFAAAATLLAILADVIDIRTTRPTAGIATGVRTLDDLGSNLGLVAFGGAAVMVIGSLLACFGLRWGAGLAGGAGLALVGWAGLTIGLAELPIALAESVTRSSSESFTLSVTRDVGWWLIAAVGVIGLLVFALSVRFAGRGGRRALNTLIAAVTALATVVVAFGPLVPVGDATFADNFRSTDPSQDLPTAFLAGRLGQVALIALVGVVGMLIVRSWGLGLAAGGLGVAALMWVTSLTRLGDRPIGIADRNPGAITTVPHAVTTVGMISALVLLTVAAAFAAYRLNRRPTS
jgi:hypothetical protein